MAIARVQPLQVSYGSGPCQVMYGDMVVVGRKLPLELGIVAACPTHGLLPGCVPVIFPWRPNTPPEWQLVPIDDLTNLGTAARPE